MAAIVRFEDIVRSGNGEMVKKIIYKTFSWGSGYTERKELSLLEEASKDSNGLLHVINVLLATGKEEDEDLAETLFEEFS